MSCLRSLLLGTTKRFSKKTVPLLSVKKTFSNSARNFLLDPMNTSCTPLVIYDLILKSWFLHQGGKIAMRNNLKIELAKFLMKKWLILLQHEVVTIRLTT